MRLKLLELKAFGPFTEQTLRFDSKTPGLHIIYGVNEAGKSVKGARVLILGLAYKKNVGDMRESPSLRLLDLLRDQGALVDYHDPFIPVIPSSREYGHLEGIASSPLDEETIAGYDAVLVATDHGGIDYAMVARCAKLVVDTRNACPDGEGVVKA